MQLLACACPLFAPVKEQCICRFDDVSLWLDALVRVLLLLLLLLLAHELQLRFNCC